jgi:hypothetical protein
MEKRSRRFLAIGLVFIGSFLLAEAALAHHGTAAYDATKQLTVRATVTAFEWANPHCELRFDVKDGSGSVQHWTVEAINPLMLGRYGWTRSSLKPGDMVTVTFRPAKNGEMIGILEKVVLPDGRELPGRQLYN